MAKSKKTDEDLEETGHRVRQKPAKDPAAREQQMISYAMDLAEQQLIDGTASSQIITHFIKMGSRQYEMEIEKLRNENELIKAKVEAYETSKEMVELYNEAMTAMSSYSRGNL